jgi:four helix bundle protein
MPRRSHREFIARLGVAVDEADESILWLRVVDAGNIADVQKSGELRWEGEEIRAILAKSHKTPRENRERLVSQRRAANSPTR